MRYIALDIGSKTIGLAASDLTLLIAQPVKTIKRVTLALDIDELINYIVLEAVKKVIIGYPINMNGSIGPRAVISEEFKAKLSKKIKYSDRIKDREIDVVLWDERLTTVQAERDLIAQDIRREDRKKVIDQLAAVHILQSYLDYERKTKNGA
jgi:putative Holliday junction resolvase